MIPHIADSDPDPTSQIPWPTARSRPQDQPDSNGVGDSAGTSTPSEINNKRVTKPPAKRRLSTWDLITLSISMGGAQMVWTVELGYGTPFLLELGLSEHVTSLVWLAGPISGLIAQPVIGALSDSSSSKYRRRFWIVLSTVALVISTFTLAFCKELAKFFVGLMNVGAGDWDQKADLWRHNTAIFLAVVSFYVLDFALNGLQASLRNLLLDVTPSGQLSAANAWHGRMTNAGNIIGYGFGFLPLESLPIIGRLGGTQFRKFCLVCCTVLVGTVALTCVSHHEEAGARRSRSSPSMNEVFSNIYSAITTLPKSIRRVCYVQVFSFMGWFPFLFYSTTYVGQIMAYEYDREPDAERATQLGAFAMMLYSIVGVLAGVILPHLASRDRRLMAHKTDVDENAEMARIRETVRQWRVEAARAGKPLKLPVMPFLLRNIWTGALLLFSVLCFSTFFISTVFQATIFISLLGICWAVTMWVPFATIMELLKEPTIPPSAPPASRRPSHIRNFSTPGQRPVVVPNERQPLLRRRSFSEYDDAVSEPDIGSAPLAGGTTLGIHNLAIVTPQLIVSIQPYWMSTAVAIATSIIFRIVDGPSSQPHTTVEDTYYGKNGVAWAIRFGGVCTLFGAMLARMVAPTPTERAMRRRLGEMKLLGEESIP
ncbi:major facilitator superfamily domain-containing protein [Panaeolus papilionaceus]|nr:major facilitator superfamily domain-containing protein [Panaeolus papilionaceus]